MEIIYRIYEIIEPEKNDWLYDNKKLLEQEVCLCNSREHFKEIMRDTYAPNKVVFGNSKKLKVGTIYIKIISEDCYDASKYIAVKDCTCDYCGKQFTQVESRIIKIKNSFELRYICDSLYEQRASEIESLNFCCNNCYRNKLNQLEKEFKEYAYKNNYLEERFINNSTFSEYKQGYIYIITKKSSKEFYVGQTKNVPIFRWGQHLLTERFKLENILDYKFEVLEVVEDIGKLNEREAYWINAKRNENVKLSLNILIPKEKENGK